MHLILKMRILRTFSANDWNQPESLCHSLYRIHLLPTISSNAENLRKLNQHLIEQR